MYEPLAGRGVDLRGGGAGGRGEGRGSAARAIRGPAGRARRRSDHVDQRPRHARHGAELWRDPPVGGGSRPSRQGRGRDARLCRPQGLSACSQLFRRHRRPLCQPDQGRPASRSTATAYSSRRTTAPTRCTAAIKGFDKRLWTVAGVTAAAQMRAWFCATSRPDGEEGYPGTLTVHRDLHARRARRADASNIEATHDEADDRQYHQPQLLQSRRRGPPGARSTTQSLTIPAATLHPGRRHPDPDRRDPLRSPARRSTFARPTASSATRIRDGRDPQIVIGQGYDHNFVIDRTVSRPRTAAGRAAGRSRLRPDPRSARPTSPGCSSTPAISSTAPLIGKTGHLYRMGDGVALEPQKSSPTRPTSPRSDRRGSIRARPITTASSIASRPPRLTLQI